jgi:hypothetical protein
MKTTMTNETRFVYFFRKIKRENANKPKRFRSIFIRKLQKRYTYQSKHNTQDINGNDSSPFVGFQFSADSSYMELKKN